jgi:SAM-dependent methyltransferase
MTDTVLPFARSEDDIARRDILAARLFTATIEALELFHVNIGDRLGLYRALADRGPLDPAGLAAAAGVAERYAREWLEQQAVAGILDVTGGSDPEGPNRRFVLPGGHAEVLIDGTSLSHRAPLASGVVGVAGALPAVLDAFVTGGGVPYRHYGADVRWCTGRINRPMFLTQLGRDWIPAMPDVHHRLHADPPARVADIGCGTGWSTIGLALAYPKVRVDGFDLDDASIVEARVHAAAHHLADRVAFHLADAATLHTATTATYDLACAFEALHDMADPIGALAAMRTLVGEKGTVLVADEAVAESFTAPGDDLERFHYGWSSLHCLPCGLAEPPADTRRPPAGTGTVMRPDTLRAYASAAGFERVDILPVDHDFWRFYRLTSRSLGASPP